MYKVQKCLLLFNYLPIWVLKIVELTFMKMQMITHLL